MQMRVVLGALLATAGIAAAVAATPKTTRKPKEAATTARCECGFLVQDDMGNGGPWIFTEAVESAFGRLKDISDDKRWVRQEFQVSAAAGRGKYGKAFSSNNVQIGQGGVELHVGSQLVQGDAVPVAEVDSTRGDLHWGSYRAGMRLTAVQGTCAAFFWYFNDTQEIDMEFLSHEYKPQSGEWPVNLVVQSRKSLEAGYDAHKSALFQRVMLTFDPTAAFHEYRFDYLSDRVVFYADGNKLAEMRGTDLPWSSGHLMLQHWSNGNPLWSGGPPHEEALLTVSYVKAYFNSTKTSFERRACSSEAMCKVESVTAANASSGGDFLTDDGQARGSRTDSGDHEDGVAHDSGAAGPQGKTEAAITMVLLTTTTTMMMITMTMMMMMEVEVDMVSTVS